MQPYVAKTAKWVFLTNLQTCVCAAPAYELNVDFAKRDCCSLLWFYGYLAIIDVIPQVTLNEEINIISSWHRF